MFQSLRNNSKVFVLYKTDEPKMETGYVMSVSLPKPKYTIPATYGQQELVVDINVKIGDTSATFNNLPASAEIADSYMGATNVVISMSKDAINAELQNLKQRSLDVIDSVAKHQRMVESYDNIILDLNPDFAEKQRQTDEINYLKEQLSAMAKNMEKLMEANNLMIGKIKGD